MLLLKESKEEEKSGTLLNLCLSPPLISLKILHPLSLKIPQKFKCTVKWYDKSKATSEVVKICTLMNNSFWNNFKAAYI